MPRIPSRLVFIWFGDHFPFSSVLAVRSAVRQCRPAETLVLHRGLSPSSTGVAEIKAEPSVRLVEAGSEWFENLPERCGGLGELFQCLEDPAARANLLRLAVLYQLGGIYLDLDTLTLRDLRPLRRYPAFCGLERLTKPVGVAQAPTPAQLLLVQARQKVRGWCARRGDGAALFRTVERLYPTAANNAVLGAAPHNPAIGTALRLIAEMTDAQRRLRFAMGTHLLQRVTQNRSQPDIEVLEPGYFYPLGPRISTHWFWPGSASRVATLVRPNTHVIHWYASSKREHAEAITSQYVHQRRHDVAFAALASPYAE